MTGESSTAESGDSTPNKSEIGNENEIESESETTNESETASEGEKASEGETTSEEQTASEAGMPETGEAQTDDADESVTRRTFIRATGATAAGAAGVATSDDAAAKQETQTYRFGGEVAGWQGRAPPEIEGEVNPTIELEAGQEYEFWFENIDGAPHNIALQDSEGNVIVRSDNITQEGATASVTFTATPQMVQYICTIHPTTMIGDVNVTGELEGGQGSLPLGLLLMAGAVVLAFISPLLFAVFLFSRGGEQGGGETTAGP